MQDGGTVIDPGGSPGDGSGADDRTGLVGAVGSGTPAADLRPWWRRPRIWFRVLRDLVSLGAAAALLIWGLPRVAGVGWAEIVAPLGRLSALEVAGLAALQLSALIAFTFTITGALPGITHRQALTVNLAGSLVANTLPFGGALGVGVTYAFCRSWGFSRSAIGVSVVLGGVFASAGKIVVPLLGLAALVLQGGTLSDTLRDAAIAGVLTLSAVLVVFVVVLISPTAARRITGGAQRATQAVLRAVGRPRRLAWQDGVEQLRRQTRDVLTAGWLPMSLGTAGYFAVYFGLFCWCLATVGVSAGVGSLLAAFALGRLLTSVAVTPGGLGVVEAGTVALLVAMGADPAATAGGVLLFTIFTHVLEIPFGVIAWLVWLSGRQGRTVQSVANTSR